MSNVSRLATHELSECLHERSETKRERRERAGREEEHGPPPQDKTHEDMKQTHPNMHSETDLSSTCGSSHQHLGASQRKCKNLPDLGLI